MNRKTRSNIALGCRSYHDRVRRALALLDQQEAEMWAEARALVDAEEKAAEIKETRKATHIKEIMNEQVPEPVD